MPYRTDPTYAHDQWLRHAAKLTLRCEGPCGEVGAREHRAPPRRREVRNT